MQFLIVGVLCFWSAIAQADENVVGIWLIEAGDGLVEISVNGNQLQGTVLGAPAGVDWDPEALDVNNPDESLRSRKLVGMVLMGEHKFDGKYWAGGWIYDPGNGKTYKSRVRLKGKDTLEVRGYIGNPLFGLTQKWRRYKKQ